MVGPTVFHRKIYWVNNYIIYTIKLRCILSDLFKKLKIISNINN